MNANRPVFRDFAIAGAVQFAVIVFAGAILDTGGEVNRATADLSLGYWCGVGLILLRRSHALRGNDRQFIRFGLLPIILVGVPITIAVWQYRRLI